jgi:hypothetical protein
MLGTTTTAGRRCTRSTPTSSPRASWIKIPTCSGVLPRAAPTQCSVSSALVFYTNVHVFIRVLGCKGKLTKQQTSLRAESAVRLWLPILFYVPRRSARPRQVRRSTSSVSFLLSPESLIELWVLTCADEEVGSKVQGRQRDRQLAFGQHQGLCVVHHSLSFCVLS